jgi:hypothetical protein
MEGVNYKNYFVFAMPYGVVVASLYLFGFWGSFDVNILEFASLSDLIKLAIYPLLVSLASLFVGYIVSEILSGNAIPPGVGADSSIGRFGRKHWRPLIAGLIIIIFVFAIFGPSPGKWFLIAFLVSFLAVPLTYLQFFIDLIPNPNARGSLLYILILIAGMAFFLGANNAHLAKSGRSSLLVDVSRSKLLLQHEPKKPVVYLGYVSGYFILLESTSGAVVFVKAKDDAPVFLLPNPNRS